MRETGASGRSVSGVTSRITFRKLKIWSRGSSFGGAIQPKFAPEAPVRCILPRDNSSKTALQASKDSVRSEYGGDSPLKKSSKRSGWRKHSLRRQ